MHPRRQHPVADRAAADHTANVLSQPEHPGLKVEAWATHSTFVRSIFIDQLSTLDSWVKLHSCPVLQGTFATNVDAGREAPL